jgi:hypothetical protein
LVVIASAVQGFVGDVGGGVGGVAGEVVGIIVVRTRTEEENAWAMCGVVRIEDE